MGHFFETEELSVGYRGDALIEHISMQIERGEIVTLIGPNGSGKSTILKSITKHLPVIGGAVWIGEDELGKISYRGLSKKVAVVLTERLQPELMTCREVVETGRYPYTGQMGILREEDELAVSEAMEEVHIAGLSDRSFQDISDGQRQRVLLARAICQQPELLVLDEPTSFLDIKYKIELLGILRKMAKKRKTTVLMSLHEIDLAAKISDRLICVNGSEIAAFGTPGEIFKGNTVHRLYGIEEGEYNTRFGSMELPRVTGKAEVFVISGGGSGIPIYRELQRRGIPFGAGILYTNDIDYELAKVLAVWVVTERPFEEISAETYDRAVALMGTCKHVVICDTAIGKMNQKLEKLIAAAKEEGYHIYYAKQEG